MKDSDQLIREIFERASRLEYQTPPFLETRVLARIREKEQTRIRRSMRFWKTLSFSTLVTTLLLATWIATSRNPAAVPRVLDALVDYPMVVRIELGNMKSLAEVAQVRVDLPSGIRFYSQGHDHLENTSSVVLNVDPANPRTYIPFAIQAGTAGKKPIFIRFLDKNNKVVAERLIDVNFKKDREKS